MPTSLDVDKGYGIDDVHEGHEAGSARMGPQELGQLRPRQYINPKMYDAGTRTTTTTTMTTTRAGRTRTLTSLIATTRADSGSTHHPLYGLALDHVWVTGHGPMDDWP